MSSHWQKWITQPGNLRVVALDGSTLANELGDLQKLTGSARIGLSEAAVGALLIASSHKSNESINLNAKGSGLRRQAIVDASPEGRARGFLLQNETATAEDWGTGVLSILYTKNFEGKTPYTGMVEISDGTLETAINEYYRDSEQLASKVGLYVRFENDQLVARGILIQALGGAAAEELELIRNLDASALRELARSAHRADGLASLIGQALGGLTLEPAERLELKSFCTCGTDRIERALVLTGEADTIDALGEDPYLEVICDFCRTEYRIARERIKALFSRDPSRLQ